MRAARRTPRWVPRLLGMATLSLAATATQAGVWVCDTAAAGNRTLRYGKTIEKDEFERFSVAFRDCFPSSYRGQRSLDLYSGGGNVDAALKIARTLVEEGRGARPIITRVSRGSHCISACTYLFVAGRMRDVETGGSFEPHGFSSYSGTRIDAAVERAKPQGEKTEWTAFQELQIGRLLALSTWLPAMAQAEPRLNWAAQWAGDLALPRNQSSIERFTDALVRAAQGFQAMSAERQAFIENVDAVVGGVMPELERVAALQAFAQVQPAGGRPGQRAVTLDEAFYADWLVREFNESAASYLRAIKDPRPTVARGGELRRTVLESQRETVGEVQQTVRAQLWPYLSSRSGDVDVRGLVTLMFSTSILYTRPVTREELCDLNIVNRDCSN